jgi:cell division protein FtsB
VKHGWKKLSFYIAGIFIIVGIIFIIFNDNGIIRYMKLKDELYTLQMRIDSLHNQNKMLENQIDSLTRKVPAKIEQTARENYDMIRPGEIKVEVIER